MFKQVTLLISYIILAHFTDCVLAHIFDLKCGEEKHPGYCVPDIICAKNHGKQVPGKCVIDLKICCSFESMREHGNSVPIGAYCGSTVRPPAELVTINIQHLTHKYQICNITITPKSTESKWLKLSFASMKLPLERNKTENVKLKYMDDDEIEEYDFGIQPSYKNRTKAEKCVNEFAAIETTKNYVRLCGELINSEHTYIIQETPQMKLIILSRRQGYNNFHNWKISISEG